MNELHKFIAHGSVSKNVQPQQLDQLFDWQKTKMRIEKKKKKNIKTEQQMSKTRNTVFVFR